MVNDSDIIPFSVMATIANSSTEQEAKHTLEAYCQSLEEDPVIVRSRRR